ncbi:MAG TPA: hypothetical protein PLT25_06190 [Acidocella sp.]|nr:hypothetical protein [Acidocella sp.]HQU04291.1 hypothetical protein [Acidocella sp.]
MSIFHTLAPMLGGLGLFFIGVKSLSVNLVPLVGHRARASFAKALRGPGSSAVGGMVAGLLTQSSTAVSWIILGLIRAGMPPTIWVLVSPAWSNVGTALLPILVAVNLATSASYVIGLVGFATYFKLDSTDRRRNLMDAAFGAALLLFGMQVVSTSVDPVREALTANGVLAYVLQSPSLLIGIGAGLSLLTQSSSVAAAIAVAAVINGLLTVPAALPLIAAANAAGILNNVLKLQGENSSGRMVFGLQAVQKLAGSLLLAVLAVLGALCPAQINTIIAMIGSHPSGQIALIFTAAQLIGALTASLLGKPFAVLLSRWKPPAESEALAQPVFLLREALNDPPVALDLVLRELARLTARVPMLLDRVRANPDMTTPPAAVLRSAGADLAVIIQNYLVSLLDQQPGRNLVAASLLLRNAVGNVAALNEALAELAAAAPQAAGLPAAGRLVESLHVLMGFVSDHAASFGVDDPDFVLRLLGDRNAMMTEMRQKLGSEDVAADGQEALFRMTILFERAVWLARRLVTELTQAQQVVTN